MKIDTLTTTLLVFALIGFTGEQRDAMADLSKTNHLKLEAKKTTKPSQGLISTVEIVVPYSALSAGNKDGLSQSYRLSDLVESKHVVVGEHPAILATGDENRELYWLRGIEVTTVDGEKVNDVNAKTGAAKTDAKKVSADKAGAEKVTTRKITTEKAGAEKVGDARVSFSVDVDSSQRNTLFPEGERCTEKQLILMPLSKQSFFLPDGLGVPVASDENWSFNFALPRGEGMAASEDGKTKSKTAPAHKPDALSRRDVKYTLSFIKDSDLVYPITAVHWTKPSLTQTIGYAEDENFARPEWRFRPQKGDAPFCGIKSGACSAPKTSTDEAKQAPVAVPTKPLASNSIPLFDPSRDGPLLKESKKIDLSTTAGDIHLQLDPQLAPEHATQLLRLFKSGAYNGTPIHRYEAGFVMQVSLAESKASGQPQLTSEQRAMLRRLPLEVDPQVKGSIIHKQYVLSMARDDNDTSSGTSSFSMLLGYAAHLDKKYTIFGAVIPDTVTVATMKRIVDEWPKHQPTILKTTEL